jgi:hypothetical protein
MTWYREEAERWGLSTKLRINPDCIDSLDTIALAARLAGHFGRLALGTPLTVAAVLHDDCTCEIDNYDFNCPVHERPPS